MKEDEDENVMTYDSSRQYIVVDTAKSACGIDMPRRIYWFDGRCFEVDSVQCIRPVANSKDGATLFTVITGGKKACVYRDYRGWYVYPKKRLTPEDIAKMERKRIKSLLEDIEAQTTKC